MMESMACHKDEKETRVNVMSHHNSHVFLMGVINPYPNLDPTSLFSFISGDTQNPFEES